MTLAVYQTSIVVSGMFLTAMAANPLVAALAGKQGVAITWRLWALAAIVPGIASLIIVPLVVYALYPPAIRLTPNARALANAELSALGSMRRAERILAAVFAALLLAWTLGPAVRIASTQAAFGAIAVLLVTGVLRWDDVARDHEMWSTFVWFAALIMMATAPGQLGVTKWFAASVTSALGDVEWKIGFLLVSLAYFYSHYFFASNTAHASSMYAPFLAVALAMGTPPLLAALVLGFFSNLFAGLTHYSAGCTPIFFGAGYVPLGTWWKVGAILSVINIIIWFGVGGAWWKVLGLW